MYSYTRPCESLTVKFLPYSADEQSFTWPCYFWWFIVYNMVVLLVYCTIYFVSCFPVTWWWKRIWRALVLLIWLKEPAQTKQKTKHQPNVCTVSLPPLNMIISSYIFKREYIRCKTWRYCDVTFLQAGHSILSKDNKQTILICSVSGLKKIRRRVSHAIFSQCYQGADTHSFHKTQN